MQSPLIYEYKGSIKFYKKYDTHLANLAGVEYKGYKIGDLPPSFGFVYNKAEDKEGKYKWFNYKGLTYLEITDASW